MSGRALTKDTECRSFGLVNWPPRGYHKTVKTCYSGRVKGKGQPDCKRGCLAKGTYSPTVSLAVPANASPSVVVENAVFTQCNDVVCAAVAFTIQNYVNYPIIFAEIDLPTPFVSDTNSAVVGVGSADFKGPSLVRPFPAIVIGVTNESKAFVQVYDTFLVPTVSPVTTEETVHVYVNFQYCTKGAPENAMSPDMMMAVM